MDNDFLNLELEVGRTKRKERKKEERKERGERTDAETGTRFYE